MSALNDDEFRDLPPRERRYEIQVSDNLFFAVFPNGVKTWVLVYRFDGIVRRQTLGTFPDMRLAQALREADKAPEASARAEPASRSNGRRTGQRRPRRWAALAAAVGLAIVTATAYFVANRGRDPASGAGPSGAAPLEPSAPDHADDVIDQTGPGDSLAMLRLAAAAHEGREGSARDGAGEIPDRISRSASEPGGETVR